ncbi:MAG: 3-methyl-2-oxobutanoate hydroxymethyltransferase [Deltaproteobacteria bacterium]|nr:3-methyl-2-oxobutanoate hydroxymethyltransferase [Deltaproteobacteria bacterium]
MERKVTVPDLQRMKEAGTKITALTAYDYSFGRIVDGAGIDVILVGDSLGMVVQGLDTTLPVTLEETIYHCRMVARARRRALLVADLPFLTYQVSVQDALRNAGRLLKEGGAEAVKLEGGVAMADTIAALTAVDMPVMGHVGLTPQSVHRMGGHRVQGRRRGRAPGDRERVIADAIAVAEAGAFAVVLEGIPPDLAEEITAQIPIPTIGIGAGRHCGGQILVLHDVLGLFDEFTPKFAKRFAELGHAASDAVARYAGEVRGGVFPDEAHSFLLRAEQPSAAVLDVTPTISIEHTPAAPVGGEPARARRRRAVG